MIGNQINSPSGNVPRGRGLRVNNVAKDLLQKRFLTATVAAGSFIRRTDAPASGVTPVASLAFSPSY